MAEILLGNIKGPKGVTFTPSVDSSGNLSWSNDGDLVNPPTVNIKGPKGDQGPAGEGGGGSGDAIPKTGDRGVLAGYETLSYGSVVNQDSPDFQYAHTDTTTGFTSVPITVENGTAGTTWVKCILTLYAGADYGGSGFSITLEDGWAWANETAPTTAGASMGIVVCVWFGQGGVAFYNEFSVM